MRRKELKIAFRNAWILWALAAAFIVAMSLFVRRTNENPPPRKWDMGGESFVPASSTYGNGYYSPVSKDDQGGNE